MVIIFFIISLMASITGAICGIGGGVIIKPALDLFNLLSVSTISFLSGCTVLAMSLYSIGRGILSSDNNINMKAGTPLAIGASIGGIAGKQMFSVVEAIFENADTVGSVQAVCLFFITLFTLIYTVNKNRIKTLHMERIPVCIVIGFVLGIISSFLGIGGGPINLVVLFFFFSMDTKTAACNSLYIILFSQFTSLITTILTKTVPEFKLYYLIVMIAGGICGGFVGHLFYKKMDNKAVEKLFSILMITIMIISCYNAYHYLYGHI